MVDLGADALHVPAIGSQVDLLPGQHIAALQGFDLIDRAAEVAQRVLDLQRMANPADAVVVQLRQAHDAESEHRRHDAEHQGQARLANHTALDDDAVRMTGPIR